MKKIASLIMAVLMLCALCVPAFAEPQTIYHSQQTWELTDNDTRLIIGGSGYAPDIPSSQLRPWAAVDTITTVEIKSGVTNIFGHAFKDCTSLKSVSIPSSVTSIDYSAFQGCTSLESVSIPWGVTIIGESAFSNCKYLKSVSIPSSVTKIDGNAFNGCDYLSSITVKASTPPALRNANAIPTHTRYGFPIYVPCGAGEDYKSKSVWSNSEIAGKISEAYMAECLPSKNGTVTLSRDCFPTGSYTAASETVTVTAVPDEGCFLKSLVWKDGTGEHNITKDKCFTMPFDNVTVTAVFGKKCDGMHSWYNGVCTICGYECPHENLENDVCAECGVKACFIGVVPHAWDKSVGKCTVCGYECQHNWSGGVCTVCEYECPHDFPNYAVTTPATCTTPGEESMCCPACHETVTRPTPIDPNAHVYSSEWTFDENYHWHVSCCELCGHSDKDDALEHIRDLSKSRYPCTVCGQEMNLSWWNGSVLSEGSLWIVIAVAVVALGGVAALVVVKKKKKPALAGDTENTDEE